jgi:hypothetical protein
MKKVFSLMMMAALVISVHADLGAQNATQKEEKEKDSKQYALTSERLDEQGKELDKQIVDYSKKIEAAIKKYDLFNTKDIRVLPYQSEYRQGKDYIEIEKHIFIKENVFKNNIAGIDDIVGIRTKKIRIFTDGQTVSRLESVIFEKYFNTRETSYVEIVDPSPTSEGTDDITFTHIYKGKKILDKKKLSEVKNTTASPIRNDIKHDFLVPHLNTFYASLLFIAEAYYSSLKDADQNMQEFLRDSSNFQ